MDISGLRHIGHSLLHGRPDGLQIVGAGTRAFISHLFSGGVTEVDLSNPASPRMLSFIPAPRGSWSLHCQAQGSLLVVANGPDMWSAPPGFNPGVSSFDIQWQFSAGLRVFDVKVPGSPREIGFLNVEGGGVHRLWFDGSPWVLASAFPPGFDEAILLLIDLSDPTRPKEVDRWWVPGMAPEEGDLRDWAPSRRISLHHATVSDGRVYGAWRDGGATIQEIDVVTGTLSRARRVAWDGPDGGGCLAHTALKLPGLDLMAVAEEGIEEGGEPQERVVALFDTSSGSEPVRVGSLPTPDVTPLAGARYGPHNLYEYRPDAWQDGSVVFSAHQGAGLRVYQLRNDEATEIGHFRPDPPARLVDPRPHRAREASSNDVFVTAQGVLYVVDANGGLDILELI